MQNFVSQKYATSVHTHVSQTAGNCFFVFSCFLIVVLVVDTIYGD